MDDKIFLVGEKGDLRPMAEKPYDTEDVLQALLERYPDLLVGDQVDPNSPRRWLLVKREMGVPDSVDSSGRWLLDHLFLDQDGVPTLVYFEVEAYKDTAGTVWLKKKPGRDFTDVDMAAVTDHAKWVGK